MADKKDQPEKERAQTISVNCLSSDYDGTISPLKARRLESRVPLQTRVMLGQISSFLPISIITMKELSFIMPRTPFAQAWSALGGLETRIGKRVFKRECLEHTLASISLAIKYAKSHITSPGVEIEEKQDSEGQIVAFCVDWRQAEDPKMAKEQAEQVATYCRLLKLRLIGCKTQPFYDVYPVDPDKGWALQEMLKELSVKKGVLYLGDSETDNSAFKAANVSIGIVHDETPVQTLDSDYLIRFEHVPGFLHALLANDLLFSPDFAMIQINPNRRKSYGEKIRA